jgi:hypothetical protein
MPERRTRFLIVLLTLAALAVLVAKETYRFYDGRAAAREVDASGAAAASAATASTTFVAARQWLVGNGYAVVVWNPHDPSGFVGVQEAGGERRLIVQGQRHLRPQSWLGNATWVDLTFRFSLEGVFQDVQARSSPVEAPGIWPTG